MGRLPLGEGTRVRAPGGTSTGVVRGVEEIMRRAWLVEVEAEDGTRWFAFSNELERDDDEEEEG